VAMKWRWMTVWASTTACMLLFAVWWLSASTSKVVDLPGGLFVKLARACIEVHRVSNTDLITYPSDWPRGVYLRGDRPSVVWMPSVSGNAESWVLKLPAWIPAFVSLAIAGGQWRITLRRRRRLNAACGLCFACAYDRRGLGAAAKCPECGTFLSK
jgi:hypothetical protein